MVAQAKGKAGMVAKGKAGKKVHKVWVPSEKAMQEAVEQCMEDELAEQEAAQQVWACGKKGPSRWIGPMMGFFKCSAPGQRLRVQLNLWETSNRSKKAAPKKAAMKKAAPKKAAPKPMKKAAPKKAKGDPGVLFV